MRHSALQLRQLALILVIALGAAACRDAEPTAAAAAETTAPEHRVDVPALTVGVADIETTLQISGSLMPQTRVAVMAKLPGILSRVSVNIGDRVRAGQIVAASDRREIDAQVDAAAASVNVVYSASTTQLKFIVPPGELTLAPANGRLVQWRSTVMNGFVVL